MSVKLKSYTLAKRARKCLVMDGLENPNAEQIAMKGSDILYEELRQENCAERGIDYQPRRHGSLGM